MAKEAEIVDVQWFSQAIHWSGALSSSESSSEPEEEEDVDEPKPSQGADHAGLIPCLVGPVGDQVSHKENTAESRK